MGGASMGGRESSRHTMGGASMGGASPRGTTTTKRNPSRPLSIQNTVDTKGWKYWCDGCGVGFHKKKNQLQHEAGKAHRRVAAEREGAPLRYQQLAPSWAAEGLLEPAGTVDVQTAWASHEVQNFPMRAICLDPSATLGTLSPALKVNPFLSDEDRLLILRAADGSPPAGPTPRGGASPLRRGDLCATCPLG